MCCEDPSGSSSFRLRRARRRPADERTERRLERLVGAGKPHGSRGSPADPPVPDRTDPETPARSVLPRGGRGRRKACEGDHGDAGRRDGPGMECFGGERPGAKVMTSADVGTRSLGPRAIRRLGVSHLLFLRAGGAETPRQRIAKRRSHRKVDASRLGGRSGLGSA
jgi:hypothetical protein